MPPKKPTRPTTVPHIDALRHPDDRRRNIPTAEFETVLSDEERRPLHVAYAHRNPDLDPQLIWRGKYAADAGDLAAAAGELVVAAPPLYIQEKIHPQVLIHDLLQQSAARTDAAQPAAQLDLFADFNGLPEAARTAEFYQHDANWTNRMILGDSLQVMASLAEREGLRGKVQCIYLDPPYGIRFNSNFQWSTTSRDVKDGNRQHITREPEQVKAFRDTWRDGIHSYLSYLRDRLTVARDLLTESGSIFVQIGDENVHRVRALLDEVFGEENVLLMIPFQKKAYQDALSLAPVNDYLVWAAKSKADLKFRPLYTETPFEGGIGKYTRIESPDLVVLDANNKDTVELARLIHQGWRLVREDYPLVSQDPSKVKQEFEYQGNIYEPPSNRHWSLKCPEGLQKLARANRLRGTGSRLYAREYWTDSAIIPLNNLWTQLKGPANPVYVVETAVEVVKRCILMTTDPGDLVLDPTCGSGTTAYVAEQWGRRWITIDTSRVALALARARLMGARYPYYLLADSPAGRAKEAELSGTSPPDTPTHGSLRQGFVYARVPHITLKSIANNSAIDVIWEQYQQTLEPLRAQLNAALGTDWEEWEIPREAGAAWQPLAREAHAAWWAQRIARQRAIDASIAERAEYELLYDKPYEDKGIVRVAGPFTVESLSPHRVLAIDENDELIPHEKFIKDPGSSYRVGYDFSAIILDHLRTSGVQQAHKDGRISFTALEGWPGRYICAEGRYTEGDSGIERRAGIFIGPEFGTVPRADLVAAAREAGDAGFDVMIACAFNYDAHASEFEKLGRIPVLKARMNADLHMADTLKNTGSGNLFVIFGEPDIEIIACADGQLQVRLRGVDVFHPQSGEVRASNTAEIACWFIDTAYNEESFFVRHAYFLGAGDPYKALKTTLRAAIDEAAWASLNSDISRPFARPSTGRIAVKVINHLGDEVMKVYAVAGA